MQERLAFGREQGRADRRALNGGNNLVFGTLRRTNQLSTIRITDSIDDGHKVYNFDSFAYQLPESTDFGKLTYIGHFQLEDGTIYRYWK